MTANEISPHYFKFSTNWTANGERRCGDCDQPYEVGQHIEITTLNPFTNYVCPDNQGMGHSGAYTGAHRPELRTLTEHLCMCGKALVEEDHERWTLSWEMRNPDSGEWHAVAKQQSKHAAHAQRDGLLELIERGEDIRNVELTDDDAEEPTIEVHEMGEDGDSWLVVGTAPDTNPARVRIEVAKWLVETIGVEDGDAVEAINLLRHDDTSFKFRDDWVYVPLSEEYPDDECLLKHGDEAPSDLPRFAGTLVQL